jgi:hypothetical protein
LQTKNRTPAFFLERTDALALELGVSLRQLAPLLDLSVASLFGYRSGKIPISNKAWSKLERKEPTHEDLPKISQNAKSLTKPNNPKSAPQTFSSVMRDDEMPHQANTKMLQKKGLREILERIATALEKLVEIEEKKK